MTGQVIWITGLSGAGKTTLASQLNCCLRKNHLNPVLLDGDVLRNIFKTTTVEQPSYSREARINLGLSYGLLCKTLSAQGFTVIIATISMYNEIYCWNRENLENYVEIYLKVPLEELYVRDPKKIYQRYKDGILKSVAGLDLTVDEPLSPDIVYDYTSTPFLWERPANLINDLMVKLGNSSYLYDGRPRGLLGGKE